MAEASEPSIADRLARRREEHRLRGRLYRMAFTVAGTFVTLAGVAMLALPGPAFVVIPIGLTMLAMEFAWAERALHHALDQADRAQQKAKAASRTQKVLGVAATVVGVLAVVAVALLYDLPVVPDP
jgi:uncharacterized protein (TIGR02611 family)